LPKICQKSGQAHPDAREMFRAFFVAAGATRKTIELSVRSLCTTASTHPEVGYKPQSPLKLEYTVRKTALPQIARFSSNWWPLDACAFPRTYYRHPKQHAAR
jgi:hypothetical protein